MAPGDSWISDSDRLALLRHGIVVLEVEAAGLRVGVAGYGEARVRRIVARRLGHAVTVDVLGDVPRRLEARRCVGWMERERGRLQLRFRLRGDEHVDDVVVEEDERTVVVLATVCTRIADEPGPCYEAPAHVSLDRPLGDRAVIDGATGAAVPYKNVYAALSRSQP